MKKKLALAAFALSVSIGQAQAGCQDVAGFVLLLPEPAGTCSVAAQYADVPVFFLPNTDPANPTCFTDLIVSSGPLFGARGVSGLTSEAAVNPFAPPVPAFAPTPLLIMQPGVASQRQFFTARSAITLRGGARLRTADAGVFETAGLSNQDPLAAVEHLTLTDGTGAYTGASGKLIISGNSIGTFAPFRGRLCTP